MFLALASDRFGADAVMLGTLTFFLVAEIITVEEGLEGFAKEGLWAVMILFVVAEGIGKTGALDWYMTKLLGHPKSLASAQLRLMLPITVVSAFLNNTPIVVVMTPIVQRWALNTRLPVQQLMIHLSFASILGGTCTLIGTSTNLVVTALLEDRYDGAIQINLFDLAIYGVPVALAGMAYTLLASPYLLPGGKGIIDATAETDELLLGARLTQWSPAVNRTVQRSGLRDTGGIYLVSVHRAATGNVHRAVSQDFVLNVGDILYFTGHNVEHFGEFCAENGLEVVTNEISTMHQQDSLEATATGSLNTEDTSTHSSGGEGLKKKDWNSLPYLELETITEIDDNKKNIIPRDVGCTKESLLTADYDELLRSINHMQDIIRNANTTNVQQRSIISPDSPTTLTASGTTLVGPGGRGAHYTNRGPAGRPQPVQVSTVDGLGPNDPPKIVVTIEKDLVVVGINARDRSGLLLDISKGLLRLNLQIHHTEAAVVVDRSVSIWRCQVIGMDLPDVEEIWSVLNSLLSADAGVEAIKKRGLRVIRAVVIKGSRLIGKTAAEVNFRTMYQTAIVAVRQEGRNIPTSDLSTVRLDVGDILILQANDDSPLLNRPPATFYKELEEALAGKQQQSGTGASLARGSSMKGFVNLIRRRSNDSISVNLPELEIDDEEWGAVSNTDSGGNKNEEAKEEERDGDTIESPIPVSTAPSGAVTSDTSGEGESADAALHRQQQQEKIWKDLMVLFKSGLQDGKEKVTSREFLTAMVVTPGSKFAGKNVAQAGILKLPELFLVSIERPSEVVESGEPNNDNGNKNTTNSNNRKKIATSALAIYKHFFPNQKPQAQDDDAGSDIQSVRTEKVAFEAVDPDEPLKEGDVLWFSGSASAVGDLRKVPGLAQYQSEEVEKINERVHDRRLVQAVVARNGPLVGHTVKELQFRTRYGAAVIAVHREGKRVHEHPGRIKLQAGDVLLLEAGPSFLGKSVENDRAFALLAEVKDSAPPRLHMLVPALLIVLAMLVAFMARLSTIFICALVASLLMVVCGILSEQEARDSFKWDVYITVAGAFGIGNAMVNAGVASGVANFMVSIGGALGIGDAGLLGAVYFATFLISNVVTNNAAAALLFPIAMDAADQTGVDRIVMSFALMLGASASFMTPFGYTTNLLIYGPGGYKYTDFLKFGTPMQIVLWILSTAFLVIEQWYLCWLAMLLVFLVVCFFRLTVFSSDKTKKKASSSSSTAAATSNKTNKSTNDASTTVASSSFAMKPVPAVGS
ncbi:hypothetical protein ACA910_018037 [Epithemia clementina (nom. ined.)]